MPEASLDKPRRNPREAPSVGWHCQPAAGGSGFRYLAARESAGPCHNTPMARDAPPPGDGRLVRARPRRVARLRERWRAVAKKGTIRLRFFRDEPELGFEALTRDATADA